MEGKSFDNQPGREEEHPIFTFTAVVGKNKFNKRSYRQGKVFYEIIPAPDCPGTEDEQREFVRCATMILPEVESSARNDDDYLGVSFRNYQSDLLLKQGIAVAERLNSPELQKLVWRVVAAGKEIIKIKAKVEAENPYQKP